jgi:hypothetical protein
MLQKLVQEQQVEIARNTECRCAPQLNLHTHTHHPTTGHAAIIPAHTPQQPAL